MGETSIGELTRQEILDLSRETTLYEWTAQRAIKSLVIDRARGVYFWDADGKRYMDVNFGLMCVTISCGDRLPTARWRSARKDGAPCLVTGDTWSV